MHGRNESVVIHILQGKTVVFNRMTSEKTDKIGNTYTMKNYTHMDLCILTCPFNLYYTNSSNSVLLFWKEITFQLIDTLNITFPFSQEGKNMICNP
jgi:hypothetical protein